MNLIASAPFFLNHYLIDPVKTNRLIYAEDYVLIKYEGETYPDVVEKVLDDNDNTADISCMKKCTPKGNRYLQMAERTGRPVVPCSRNSKKFPLLQGKAVLDLFSLLMFSSSN